MEVKVVIGSNYGDEGKGLVSANLAREAKQSNKKSLTVFYNGTVQRAHSFGNKVLHCLAAGEEFGSDTYYHHMFVVDPIAVWLTQSRVYIDPNCRVILPCDVMENRKVEKDRGDKRHGSCGLGLFAAVKRSKKLEDNVVINDFCSPYNLYFKLKEIEQRHPTEKDTLYNIDMFMRAVAWIVSNCKIITFDDLVKNHQYDTIIYEGGQGLLLDQTNMDDFPHITPSSVGMHNITHDINKLNCTPELFYVSRTYMTRHGAGPMEFECNKEDINPSIVDNVNQPNEWQGSLRFGRIDLNTLYQRIQKDAATYNNNSNINLVFTQLNYTDNKIETNNGRVDIIKPDFCSKIYISNDKYYIFNKE